MPSRDNVDTTPRGSTTRLHGLNAYVTEPADGRQIDGVVVIVSDAFGWEFAQTRLLADHYADKGGYRVLVPDYLGVTLPPSVIESLQGYFGNGNLLYKACCALWVAIFFLPFLFYQRFVRLDDAGSTLATFLSAVRSGPEAMRGLPVFAAGFSYGGKFALDLARRPNPSVAAVFVAHPSHVRLPTDLERLVAPVSFALARHDHALGGKNVDIVERLVAKGSAKCEVKVYQAGHAFAVRSDFTGRDSLDAADAAEDQAIKWFRSKS